MWPPRQWRWTGTSSPHPALSAAGSGRRKRDSERFGKTPACSSPSILRGGQAGPPVTLEDTYKSPGLTPCPPPSQFRQVGGSSALQRAALASDAAGGTLDGRGVSECHAPGGGDSSIPVWGCPGALCLAGAWSSSALVTRGHCHVNLPPGLAQVSSQDWGLLRPQDVGPARAGTREAGAPVWV